MESPALWTSVHGCNLRDLSNASHKRRRISVQRRTTLYLDKEAYSPLTLRKQEKRLFTVPNGLRILGNEHTRIKGSIVHNPSSLHGIPERSECVDRSRYSIPQHALHHKRSPAHEEPPGGHADSEQSVQSHQSEVRLSDREEHPAELQVDQTRAVPERPPLEHQNRKFEDEARYHDTQVGEEEVDVEEVGGGAELAVGEDDEENAEGEDDTEATRDHDRVAEDEELPPRPPGGETRNESSSKRRCESDGLRISVTAPLVSPSRMSHQ